MKIDVHRETKRGDVITVLEDFPITWKRKKFTILCGFESDGFSTPEFLWTTVSPAIDPRTLRGAVSHDWVYRVQPPNWTRAQADAMLYDFVRADGLNWWRSQKAYWGLRWFGGKAWKDNQKKEAENVPEK